MDAQLQPLRGTPSSFESCPLVLGPLIHCIPGTAWGDIPSAAASVQLVFVGASNLLLNFGLSIDVE